MGLPKLWNEMNAQVLTVNHGPDCYCCGRVDVRVDVSHGDYIMAMCEYCDRIWLDRSAH